MSAHTPGPWVLRGGQIYAVPAEPIDANSDFEPFCIADRDMDQRIDFDTIGEANGRLIAAAPDLLEALKALHDDIVEYVTINNLHDADGSPAINNFPMKQARAAIAKATGGA